MPLLNGFHLKLNRCGVLLVSYQLVNIALGSLAP